MNRGTLARTAAMVAGFSLISRVLGMVREMLLAGSLGTRGSGGGKADAFNTSLLVVNSVAAVLAYTMVAVIIPAVEHERRDHDEHSAWRLIWAIGTWVVLVLVALSGVLAIWPGVIGGLFPLDAARAALVNDLLQIMAPALALQGITGLVTAVLQAHRKFLGPAVVGIAFNLGIIVSLILVHGSVRAASWGVVAGAIAQLVFQLPQLIQVVRAGGVLRPQLSHPRMGLLLGNLAPVGAASILQQINSFSDKYFAAPLAKGQIAALNYAHSAGSLPKAAILTPLLTPLFPVIARMAAERRHDQTVRAVNRAAGVLGFVSIPLGALMMLYPVELTRVVFGHGKCDVHCVSDIAGPLRFLAIATWAGFLGYLLNSTLNALNASRALFVSTMVSVVVTIGFDIVLVGPMGISGLALASAIGVTATLVVSFVRLQRLLPTLTLQELGGQQLRIALAATAAVAVAWLADTVLPTADRGAVALVAPLLVKIAIAAAVFLAAMRLLAPNELRESLASAGAVFHRRDRKP